MGTEYPKDHLVRPAYEKGYRDFNNGQLSCPFTEGTVRQKEWQRGQNAAYFDNLKRLQLRKKFFYRKPK